MRFRDTRSPADVLEELAAVLRDSIDSFMSSTEPGPDNETTPAVSQQSPQRTTDSSNRDTPYQPLEELNQQSMTYHDYEAAQLLTNLRAHSESENAQLLTDQRANSESGWMSVNMPPGIPVSGRVQESELDHAARHMEVSEENYAEEWWETYSGSDSDSGSDPDSDSDSETSPADTNTEDWIPDSSWGSESETVQDAPGTRPKSAGGINQPTAAPRPNRIPGDFYYHRPKASLLDKGQLRRYAMVNWQMDRMRRLWLQRGN